MGIRNLANYRGYGQQGETRCKLSTNHLAIQVGQISPRVAPGKEHVPIRAIAYANVVNPSKKWFTFSGL